MAYVYVGEMSVRRWRKVIEGMLVDGEELLTTVWAIQCDPPTGSNGTIGGALSVTSSRMIFASKQEKRSIPFTSISSVQVHKAFMSRCVQIHYDGIVQNYLTTSQDCPNVINIAEAQRVKLNALSPPPLPAPGAGAPLLAPPPLPAPGAGAPLLAPPSGVGPLPLVCVLTHGTDIEIGVNKQHASMVALQYLIGAPDEAGDISRQVPVWMWRDDTSQYPDSVRVETPTGELVGWVLKDDSTLACQIVDQIGEVVPRSEPRAVGRRIIFEVIAEVEAYWEPGDEPELLSVLLGIKQPAEVHPRFES
jgi:hypothetical protein